MEGRIWRWASVLALLAWTSVGHAEEEVGIVDDVVMEDHMVVIEDAVFFLTPDTKLVGMNGEKVTIEGVPLGSKVLYDYDEERRTLRRLEILPEWKYRDWVQRR